ncbi:hypothetical protein DN752_05875 [Echinicola strongylocentroti]|uniref:Alpha-galactosidase NEW3 domain-containing protein n=1 Tax=Echinicola strongylocentroti TaxID=1795355 RepID=A0A2Z4IG69_9BACT|nr:NEW3 domain-containing protein [Echinicola strongylocentroti]AWW29687.1 hypothetical protein DN752_05875 [Echinicola strongylocentroti]
MSVDSFNNGKPKMGMQYLFLLMMVFVLFSSPLGWAAQGPEGSSSFTARLVNIEAPVNETFRYQATLKNSSGQTMQYDLNVKAPDGWRVKFKVSGQQVTSLKLEEGKSENVSIEVNPAHGSEPSTYPISVYAIAGQDSLGLSLEAVVEGAYELELSTPSGRLSGEITEGKRKEINLQVKNTGSLALESVSLSSRTPPKWEASFSPSSIEKLAPGKTADVVVTLTVPDKTLPGDYVTRFTAKSDETNSEASYRMTVTTSLLSGWIGIMVILMAIGLVYYLVRKFGRR